MDLTAVQQLSSILEGKLNNYTFAEILSSLQSLSGAPVHPYEQAKYKYFGSNYHFPTIDEIPFPLDFNYNTYTKELSSIFNNTNLAGHSALTAFEDKIKNFDNSGILNRADIENIVITDENIIKNNIKFTEAVKSISLSDIETKPIEVAQKLLSFYVKMFR
jgi:hypothetical protein